MSAKCQLETSCRVPGHGLHGRKCIAVAADSAAKMKNTKPGPSAITATMASPMPYPPRRRFDGEGDANDEEQHRQERLKQKKELASFTL